MNFQPAVWVVRGGDNNELASQIKARQSVAIGWRQIDASHATSRDDIRKLFELEAPSLATPNSIGQVFRFVSEIEIGSYILTPEKATSTIHVTRCLGPCRFDRSIFGEDYPHVRPVEFVKTIPRGAFSLGVRNTLGSTLTVFRADIALEELEALLSGGTAAVTSSGADPGLWADELEGQAEGQILDALLALDPYGFQRFVAEVLRAMGYIVQDGPKGADGGVDFLAYRDAFGLESPRIKGQVKRQIGAAGIADVGYLHGVLGQGESGLFVSMGGFTKDAQNAPFVKNGRVALIAGIEFLHLVIQHYERLSADATRLLPLRRIYLPEKPAV